MLQDLDKALPSYFKDAFERTDKIFFAYHTGENKFLFLNPAFEKIWPLTRTEATQKPSVLLKHIHPKDKEYIINAYQEVLRSNKQKVVEFRVQHEDEAVNWLQLSPYLSEDEEGRQIITGFAEDITGRKDKEDNLQKFAAKKDAIMEILSHDLAGPLKNIKGIAALMGKELKEIDHPKLDKLVAMIEETSERSIRLIREFVKQEFLQAENTEMIKRRVDLVEKMKEVIDQYQNSAIEISKNFQMNLSEEPIFLKLDVYKFTQVINNLISNAIKFTKDDGHITLSLEDKGNSVLISVADDGVGIPEKYHAGLFEKFTKARRPGLKGEPSVGLGMSIIKTIVDWHGGKIWFKSKVGEGSTFYVELPKE